MVTRILQEGEIPTVGPYGRYNEYIPPEMGFKEHWPVRYSGWWLLYGSPFYLLILTGIPTSVT